MNFGAQNNRKKFQVHVQGCKVIEQFFFARVFVFGSVCCRYLIFVWNFIELIVNVALQFFVFNDSTMDSRWSFVGNVMELTALLSSKSAGTLTPSKNVLCTAVSKIPPATLFKLSKQPADKDAFISVQRNSWWFHSASYKNIYDWKTCLIKSTLQTTTNYFGTI